MDNLNNFSALIQLISAVNFANIKLNFHQRIFDLIANVDDIYDRKFKKIQSAIEADIVSLNSLEPLETKDGKSNSKHIEQLRSRYSELNEKWDKKHSVLGEQFKKCNQQRGIKSFFLFISLYCIYDLALFAIIQSFPDRDFYRLALNSLSIVTIVISLGYLYKIVRQNYKHKDEKLYKVTLSLSVISIIIALIIAAVIIKVEGEGIVMTFMVNDYLSIAAILLPFFPCFLCALIYVIQEIKIRIITFRSTSDLRKEQKRLHNEKVKLDETYSLFQGPNTNAPIGFD